MARFLLPLGLLTALLLGLLGRADAGPAPSEGVADVLIYPFGVMSEVRRADLTVPMQVQLNNAGGAAAVLERLRVSTLDGEPLAERSLDGRGIEGDDGFVRDLYLGMETVEPDFSHRHRNRLFIPLEEREPLGPEAESRMMEEIAYGVDLLQRSGAPSMAMAPFEVDLAALFGGDAEPGDVAAFRIEVDWRDETGASRTTAVDREMRMLPPFLPPPPGHASLGAGAWFRGDLHVHNCRDEAVFGCDSCPAETVNLTGGFTNAELKPQFQALGFDFFSSTSHSYCISTSEFNDVLAESVALTDPTFVMLASTEVSGRETGPQQGSDSADLFCSLGFGRGDVFHMGAHHITSQKPGGQDDVLDFCDAPLFTQHENLSAVNGEGGFAVVNHPASGFWAFNSVAEMKGMERGGFKGVEVWNGSEGPAYFQTFQRDWWVDRLTEGLVLYPYSGSDTHDAAYDFGVVNTWVEGGLDPDNLADALQGGRSYLSNGPFLEVGLRDARGRSLPMGGVAVALASQVPPNFQVTVEVPYNVGTEVGTLTVYRGVVGAGETVVSQQTGLTGSGTLQLPDTLPQVSSWYRAEFHNGAFTQSALTTPVFVFLR